MLAAIAFRLFVLTVVLGPCRTRLRSSRGHIETPFTLYAQYQKHAFGVNGESFWLWRLGENLSCSTRSSRNDKVRVQRLNLTGCDSYEYVNTFEKVGGLSSQWPKAYKKQGSEERVQLGHIQYSTELDTQRCHVHPPHGLRTLLVSWQK